MKYMVMECHLSYAVVLDENGRFLNVANRHYEVGQMVNDVIEMNDAQPVIKEKPKKRYKWISSIAAMAACLILVVTSVFQFGASPYMSVYMAINPEVRIDVNKHDIVIDVEGINEDGKILVEDYSYRKKNLNIVMDELVDRAIEMGYLYEGGQITLTLEADDGEWIMTKSDSLDVHLNEYLTDRLSVTIEITNKNSGNEVIIIPVGPESNTLDTNYGESDYGDTTFAPSTDVTIPSEDNQTDYEDTDYGPNNDGVTDYNDTDYGPNNDGVTDYNDTDYGPNNDGVTNYDDDNDYGDNSSGDSNYDDAGDSNYDNDSDDEDGNSDYD